MKKAAAIALGLSLFSCRIAFANELSAPETVSKPIIFEKKDHVLIVAPHPDDETLGCAGVIQGALAKGAAVKVVYLTNGESNEVSSIVYQRRPLLVKKDFVRIGEVRKNEAVEAMAGLGLKREDLIFLGYPDVGTMKIWQGYWGQTKPFRSFITRINKVLDKDENGYGGYYLGDNIVRDLEKVLTDFRPDHIFVTAFTDLHTDHQAAYLYLNVALLDLEGSLGRTPAVYQYLVHARSRDRKRASDPSGRKRPVRGPRHGSDRYYALTGDEIEKKKEAVLEYRSQVAYNKLFLLSFAGPREVFFRVSAETLPKEPVTLDGDPFGAQPSGETRYRLSGEELWVEIPFGTVLDQMGALHSYLFGYKKGAAFSAMPKLNLRLFGHKLSVKDKRKTIRSQEICYKVENKRAIVRIPVSLLGEPDAIFVSTQAGSHNPVHHDEAWRILKIAPKEQA